MSLLFADHFYCYNSSVFLESVCNNQGSCADQVNSECVCEGQYLKETYCLTTLSEELNGANLPLYVVFVIAYSVLTLLTVYDFCINLKLKGFRLDGPIIIGNFTMFFACVALIISFIIRYIEHSANTNLYYDVIKTLGFFSEFLTLMTYSITTLIWISVILTAKCLGEEMKGLTIFRRYVLVANLILLPLYFTSGVLRLVFDSEFFVMLSTIVSMVVLFFDLSVIVGTSVFILKAFLWIRSLETAKRTPATERAHSKTKFLIGANVTATLNFIQWIVGSVYGTTAARFHLVRLFINVTEIILFFFLLLILERHIIRLPLYIRTGKIGRSSSESLNSPTTQSMSLSKKKTSSRDRTRDSAWVAQTGAHSHSVVTPLSSDFHEDLARSGSLSELSESYSRSDSASGAG